MRIGKEVAHDLAGAAKTKKLFDLCGLEHRFIDSHARHRWYEHHADVECQQRFGGHIGAGPDVDLLSAVGRDLHGHGPALVVLELNLDPASIPVRSVPPEEIEAQ